MATVVDDFTRIFGESSKNPPLPRPPVFETVEAERLHRKQRLAGAYRLFSKFGFDDGIAGHITARDPEHLDHFWVNPFGMHFSHIRVRDLILVNHRGEVVRGDKPLNQAAFAIHSRIHAARPDVVAAAHAHTTYGMAMAALGRNVEPITQDACAFYQDCGVFEQFDGLVLSQEQGDALARTLGQGKALVLRNHGILTAGHSVDEAAWWFISLERACQVQLLAEVAGTPVRIDDVNARLAAGQVGSHDAGWFQFQPLWDRIVREQPDLLED
ncbi:MAG: class II aldolase/adducin family protein [Chloroflexi bacterium]|nr:class II aldolase/adducin family protein [Chloroflexota bacterium]